MVPVNVKICGITNQADALAAADAGADALGFMFFERSPRFVRSKVVAEIVRQLPPFIAKVGVFVNAPEITIRNIIEESRLDTLQFHGDESPEFCRQFGMRAIKAFRVENESSLGPMEAYGQETWLLDSFVSGKLGGTGVAFNWNLASAAARMNSRVILAGGLTPENVAEAVRQVRPFGVDVSSGVESAPGRKDPVKMRAFVEAVRSAR